MSVAMSVTRKLKQCRLISVCYCGSSYVGVLAFVLSFPTRVLENGSPVVVWLSGYSLIVCLFSHYLVKRVWYSRPKVYSMIVISVTGISTVLLAAVCTWAFLYYCGGYIHKVPFVLQQRTSVVDVSERMAITTTVGFICSVFELICVILLFFLYQRLSLDWAKAVVWLKKDVSPDRPSRATSDTLLAEKYTYYNDPRKTLLEGTYLQQDM